MPVTRQKSDSSGMDSDTSPGCRLRDVSRGGSLESGSSSSRETAVCFISSDDESLKHLTHEEKDVILFFEETIDSLEDDFEEPILCDSGNRCYSSRSLEESTSSPSEPEDVIDLVQPPPAAGEAEHLPDGPQAAGEEEAQEARAPDPTAPEALALPLAPPGPSAPAQPRRELLSPPPAEHPKLPRSVPTPLVIAQKISEKLAGNEALSPTSPSKEGRSGEWRTLTSPAPRNGDHVTEPSPALANGFQTIHDVLKSEPSPFVPTGKTITFRPDPALPGKLAHQGPRPPDCGQDARRRSGSLPRGITVQFSGRGSSEEARREALRKLGLLKENS
uniref:Proline and serine rich 2 n=1 Tax=Propithecus coquereli TaxID=379532 RepID=A0A2K6EPC8_PROCO